MLVLGKRGSRAAIEASHAPISVSYMYSKQCVAILVHSVVAAAARPSKFRKCEISRNSSVNSPVGCRPHYGANVVLRIGNIQRQRTRVCSPLGRIGLVMKFDLDSATCVRSMCMTKRREPKLETTRTEDVIRCALKSS